MNWGQYIVKKQVDLSKDKLDKNLPDYLGAGRSYVTPCLGNHMTSILQFFFLGQEFWLTYKCNYL